MFIDTHAHFDLCMEDRGVTEESLISGLRENSIKHSVQISIEADNLSWSRDFASRNRDSGILFTLGIHPSSAAGEDNIFQLSDCVDSVMRSEDADILFGIGECGLDFYRMRQPREHQIQSFTRQIEIAKRWGLPIIVHSREAFPETVSILEKQRPPKGIMHCFPGNKDMARTALDLGFHISFAGNLTYNNAPGIREAAAFVPSDRLLVETDAPFLTPVPLRGKRNRSEYILHTYKFISEIRKESLLRVQDAVYNNFLELNKR